MGWRMKTNEKEAMIMVYNVFFIIQHFFPFFLSKKFFLMQSWSIQYVEQRPSLIMMALEGEEKNKRGNTPF